MPHTLGRGKKIYPGDIRHGTRWATHEERELAVRALRSLELERNVITLVPAPEPHFSGHKIRVQTEKNPAWYIDFGTPYWRSKRFFFLKRTRVERALKRVAVTGIVKRNGYEVKLLELLAKYAHMHHNEASVGL